MTTQDSKIDEAPVVIKDGRFTILNLNFPSSLVKSLQMFQKDQSLCDVEIATSDDSGLSTKKTGHSIFAHSCVLASSSSFFYGLLTGADLKDQKKKMILLNKINFKYVKVCIKFMYGYSVNFSEEELPNLIQMAEMFKISNLVKYCQLVKDILSQGKSLIPINVCDVKTNALAVENKSETLDLMGVSLSGIPGTVNDCGIETDVFSAEDKSETKMKESYNPWDHTYHTVNENTKDPDRIKDKFTTDPDNHCESKQKEKNVFKKRGRLSKVKIRKVNPLKKYDTMAQAYAARKQRENIPTVCKHCGETFPDYRAMRRHLEKIYRQVMPCQYCGKGFQTNQELRLHERRHRGVKNFKCDECDFVAVTKVEITLHKVSHEKEKKFMCDLCGGSYKTEKNLKTHQKHAHSDTAEKFMCEYCDYSASRKGQMKRHMITHDSSLKHQCQHCHKSYNKKYSLKLHLHNIHGESAPAPTPRSLTKEIEDTINKASELEQINKSVKECQISALPFDIFEAQEVEIEAEKLFPSEISDEVYQSSHNIEEGITFDDFQGSSNMQQDEALGIHDFKLDLYG